MRAVLISSALAWALAVPVCAFQYPGQQPPIGYPPGQGPLGPGGLSLPSRGHKTKQKQAQLPTIEADGLVLSNDGNKLQVDVPDGRTLTMTLNSATQWLRDNGTAQPAEFVKGTKVHLVAAEDDESYLTAVSVKWLAKPAGGQTTIPADEEMAKPDILKPPDAPDRPILRRGKPADQRNLQNEPNSDDDKNEDNSRNGGNEAKARPAKKSGDDAIDFTIEDSSSSAPQRTNAYDELIERAREWSQSFTNGLPNFLCQQNTTRYLQQSRTEGFEPLDVVTAKVLYEDGREKYSQITVGGKRTNKSMMEIGGSTSTGEFASVLAGLFEPITHAEFKFVQSSTLGKDATAMYHFTVPLAHSNWTIQVGGQTLRPAYSGTIWVSKATAEVRRIEMQADNIPKDFPHDSLAMAVDWAPVPLGTRKFLLPVHAENLACQRGSSICTKNAIDFRDYHKYEGESTIEFK